jgi:hypothetical protein
MDSGKPLTKPPVFFIFKPMNMGVHQVARKRKTGFLDGF